MNHELYRNYFSQIVAGEADSYDFKSTKQQVNLTRIRDLDRLKFPDRSNIQQYNRHQKWLPYPTDTVVSSRGCPYRVPSAHQKLSGISDTPSGVPGMSWMK